MKYYSPNSTGTVTDSDWELATGNVACYTVVVNGTEDRWGNCDNHGGLGTNAAILRARTLQH